MCDTPKRCRNCIEAGSVAKYWHPTCIVARAAAAVVRFTPAVAARLLVFPRLVDLHGAIHSGRLLPLVPLEALEVCGPASWRTSARMSARRLRDACERGDLDVVNDEIARGADVNDAVGASWTALHRAAERGRVQIVRALLNAGAEVGAETKTGGT